MTIEASAASVRAPSTSDGLEATWSAPTLHVAVSPNVRHDRASARYRLDAGLSSLRTIVLLV